MKKNNRGFTMVELLAVVVILGILSVVSIGTIQGVLNKAKDRYYKSQKDNMIIAAQSYIKNNKNLEPKVSGKYVEIKVDKLQSEKYIDKIVDYQKQTCSSANSYVRAFKYEDSIYYYAYLECPNYAPAQNTDTSVLDIATTFEGDLTNLAEAKAKIKITDNNGGRDIPVGIVSYQYKIYENDKLAYTSDVFNTKKTNTLEKIISLHDYVPGTVKVTVTATNVYGITLTKSVTQNYVDTIAPICGAVTGATTTWSTGTRRISVKCSDGNGSGCKRDEFVREFTGSAKEGTIRIEDKAGNHADCPVNVYLDNTPPVVNTTTKTAVTDNLTINLSDDMGLTGYAIQTTQTIPTSWTAINNQKTFTQKFSKETGTYYIYAIDVAGNISVKSQYVLKMNPPTCSLSLSGTTASGWYRSNVTVTMTTSGTVSSKGLATTANSTNGLTSVTHTANTSSVTYYGYVANEAGSASCSKTFKLDKGPGKPSISLNGYGSGSWTNQNVTISASTSSTFNISRWEYSHNGTSWQTGIESWSANFGTGKKSINSTITWDGQWTFYVRAVNVNGFASPASNAFVIRIDKTPPQYTRVQSFCGNIWCLPPEHHAYVKINYYDSGSGIGRRYVEWWDTQYQNNHLKNDVNLGGSTGGQEDTLDAVGPWQAFEHKIWDVAGNYNQWIDHNINIAGCPNVSC